MPNGFRNVAIGCQGTTGVYVTSRSLTADLSSGWPSWPTTPTAPESEHLMTDQNRSHFTLVSDRSGSVSAFRKDFEGGLNQAIHDQAASGVPTTITLIQFDTVVEIVTRMTPAADVPHYQLRPRGGTALMDAVGYAITATGEDLAALPEDQRPGKVMVLIVTDGLENASKEWTMPKVREAIAHQRTVYGWEFAFLGADDSAWTGREPA